MTRLVTHPELCTGCRACEVVCSYHHEGFFSRKMGSIYVRRMERKGEFEIVVYKENKEGRQACDLCSGEKKPLCVRFCSTKALSIEEV